MQFHIITNVWGPKYISFFLDVTLKNILSPGNLPAMRLLGRVTYRIFTNLVGNGKLWTARFMNCCIKLGMLRLLPLLAIGSRRLNGMFIGSIDQLQKQNWRGLSCLRAARHNMGRWKPRIFRCQTGRGLRRCGLSICLG